MKCEIEEIKRVWDKDTENDVIEMKIILYRPFLPDKPTKWHENTDKEYEKEVTAWRKIMYEKQKIIDEMFSFKIGKAIIKQDD